MARIVKPLSDKQIKEAKPKAKDYKLTDGDGLGLIVSKSGRKRWVFAFISPDTGKLNNTGLGNYPVLSLAEAREKRTELKKLVMRGIDPITEKKRAKAQRISEHNRSFEKVFNEWLEFEAKSILPQTLKTKRGRIENHVMPILKDRGIKSITHGEIADILKETSKTTPQTAEIINQILNRVFLFAVSSGYAELNIMANIDAKSLIPKTKVEHYAKLTERQDLKAFFNAIYDYPHFETIKNAMKLCLHLPLRAAPLSRLKWDYVDFDRRLLTIPRAEQKIKRSEIGDFKLPLSDEVMRILEDQAKLSRAYEHIFINSHFTGHIHKDTATNAIKGFDFRDRQTGRVVTLHSLRGIFMTQAFNNMQKHGVSKEAIKKALDHLHGDKVDLSYSEKADFLDELKILLDWWSSYILEIKDN
ncbi:integrase arm-type DNA-binding domain-containing protein [uncultured Campylobacter sp.]|uniref:tyrosine-type recombinase/integrase n=1 Tax=uncultured Campylobacter sp. TaxID=218934 RepID=UPI00262533E3|nr:integrase arm-type DNA-binding domain-containing protein [uncultured Campylobacter sp.]